MRTMERVVSVVGAMSVLAVYVPICASADVISLNTYSSGLFEHLGLHDLSSLANNGVNNKNQNASAETARDSPQGLQSCFSLEQSRYCGGWYSDYSMSALVAVGGHRVSSADELDDVMDNYFGSSDEHSYINHFFGCQSWAGQPVSRYRISYTCRSLLESKEAKECNRNKIAPSPICASTCDMYVHEWSALTSNHTMCVNNVLSEDRRRSLANGCLSWPYNGTVSCVASVESDAEVCGFAVKSVIGNSGDSAEKARLCAYCKETGSSCCHRLFVRLQCGESESRGSSLKGLTIAMALLLSAVCLAVVWCFYRWYYMRNGNGNSKQAAKPKYAWTQSNGPPNSANSGLDGCSADLVTESANTAFVLAENIGTCQDSKNICSASAKSTHPEQTRHPLMFVSKISRLFCRIRHTRASQESTQAVSTITLSLPRSPTTELQQPGPPDTNALGLTIAKRGQSLRGLNPRECDSPSSNESSSLQPHPTISETNFYDVPEQHIADSDSTNSVGDSDIFEVLYPYSPVESDELAITPGEKIRVLRVFSDGWAFVQRVDDGKIGAIPAVCLDSTLR